MVVAGVVVAGVVVAGVVVTGVVVTGVAASSSKAASCASSAFSASLRAARAAVNSGLGSLLEQAPLKRVKARTTPIRRANELLKRLVTLQEYYKSFFF